MRPTSVTRPTLSFLSQVAPAAEADGLASADADALAAADGAADAAADGAAADGEAELPLPEHAETKMARPANRVKPRRLCMCPPPDPPTPAEWRRWLRGDSVPTAWSPVGTDGASYRMGRDLGILARCRNRSRSSSIAIPVTTTPWP